MNDEHMINFVLPIGWEMYMPIHNISYIMDILLSQYNHKEKKGDIKETLIN